MMKPPRRIMDRKMQLIFLLFYCCFRNSGNALDITCTATRSGGHTTYNLSESAASGDCDYDWTSPRGHVLAHQNGKDDSKVVNKTLSSLTTYECFDQLDYQKTCFSEGSRRTAKCAINCTAASALELPGDKVTPASISDAVIITLILCLVGLLVVLLLLAGICWYYRNRICSMRTKLGEWIRGPRGQVNQAVADPAILYTAVAIAE